MKFSISLFLFFCLELYGQIDVITNKTNDLPNLSQQELSNIYLKKSTTINDKKVTPVDNIQNQNEFYKKVVKKTPQQVHAYWMKEIFTGKKTPPKKIEESQVEEELKTGENTITYSSNKHTDTQVIYETK